MASKQKIIEILAELSSIYSSLGDEYRALAYSKAIMSIRNNTKKGIGSSIQAKIDEIKKTGKLQLLEDLKKNPVFLEQQELLKVHGITRNFIDKYNVKSIGELEDKINRGLIKLTNAQRLGLEYYDELKKKIPRTQMKAIGDIIINRIKTIPSVISAELVGSYRRGVEMSKDIDILVVSDNPNISVEVLRKIKKIIVGTFTSGLRKFSGIVDVHSQERHIDIMYAHPDEYATSLLAFTGSAGFNRLMRLKAIEMGMKLNEKGLFKGNKKIPTKTEKEIFKKLKLKYIKPELRSLK